MKAKEYMERWEREGRTDTSLAKIGNEFFLEVSKIGIARHISSDEALFSILDEQDNKWRVFARLDKEKEVNPDGFAKMVEIVTPDIYALWHFGNLANMARTVQREHAKNGCKICQKHIEMIDQKEK